VECCGLGPTWKAKRHHSGKLGYTQFSDLGFVTCKVNSVAGSSLKVDGRVTICGSSITMLPYAEVIKRSLQCKLSYVAVVNGKARQVIPLVSLWQQISFELPHNKAVLFIKYCCGSVPKRELIVGNPKIQTEQNKRRCEKYEGVFKYSGLTL
jgi:hypothetical protein